MSLGKIKAEFTHIHNAKDGGYDLTFHVDEQEKEPLFSLMRALRKRRALSETRVLLDVLPYLTGAELNRNQFLWILLDILADARSAKSGEEITPRACFAELMEAFGVPGLRFTCDRDDAERLLHVFAAFTIIEESKSQLICRAFPDAAVLEPERISSLIDAVFDELILLGTIHDEDVQYLYNQWYC